MEQSGTDSQSGTALDSFIFVFQILMALALENAAVVFFGGTGGHLRPPDYFSVYHVATFIAFAFLLILFIQGDILALRKAYKGGFKDTGFRPIVDYALLFSHSALFFAISVTFSDLDTRPLLFYKTVGVLLGLNVIWSLLSLLVEWRLKLGFERRLMFLKYAIQNGAAVAIGYALWLNNVPDLTYLLLAVLYLRNFVDLLLSYSSYFP